MIWVQVEHQGLHSHGNLLCADIVSDLQDFEATVLQGHVEGLERGLSDLASAVAPCYEPAFDIVQTIATDMCKP